jgi:SAM-dependent methyltransferase
MSQVTERVAHWDRQYAEESPPWDTEGVESEVARVVNGLYGRPIPLGRAVDIGCGTGSDAIWLSQRGFDVMGIDLSPAAIETARQRARRSRADVDFRVADLLGDGSDLPAGPFDLLLDVGCYGPLRRIDAAGYMRSLGRLTRRGSLGLVLTGHAGEAETPTGPPVVAGGDLIREFAPLFHIRELREFRFDRSGDGHEYLGWSLLVERR